MSAGYSCTIPPLLLKTSLQLENIVNKNNKTGCFSFAHCMALVALAVVAVVPAVLSAHQVSTMDAHMRSSDSMYVSGSLMIRLPGDLPAAN